MAKKSKKKSNKKESLGVGVSIIVLIVTFLARKILTKSYTKITGVKPPKPGDNDQPLARILTWTALSTFAIGAIEGLVQKFFTDRNKG